MTGFVTPLLIAEASAVAILVGALVQIAARHRRSQRWAARSAEVEMHLLDDLVHNTALGGPQLAALPLPWRTRVLANLATSVGSTERSILRELADECGVSARIRTQLSSRRPSKRIAALQAMTPLEMQELRGMTLLADRRAPVRSAATWWLAIAYCNADAARQIAARADDLDPRVRHIAAEALIACGATAIPEVIDLIANGSPAARFTGLLAAIGLNDPAIAMAASTSLTDPDAAIRVAAVRALAGAATPTLRAQLTELLHDPDPSVRASAARSLGHGRRLEDALHIGPLLRDPVNGVRIAASQSLLTLGPVGELAVRSTARAQREPAGSP